MDDRVIADDSAAVLLRLGEWAQWQRAWSADDDIGFPKTSPTFREHRSGVASDDTFDHLCEQIDIWAARATDAIIDDLPPIERAAVCHKHLHAVFRGRDIDAAYAAALDRLTTAMAAKGLLV